MKRAICKISIIGILLFALRAECKPQQDVVIGTWTPSYGKTYVEYYVPVKTIINGPKYHPLTGENPPLSVKKATILALAAAKQRHKQLRTFEVDSINLTKSASEIDGKDFDYWFYYISFTAGNGAWVWFHVLMDGTVAKARTVKQQNAN